MLSSLQNLSSFFKFQDKKTAYTYLAIRKRICYNANRQKDKACPWRAHTKNPRAAISGVFLFLFFQTGRLIPAGWLPTIYRRPAIWWYSGRLHQPQRRLQKIKLIPWQAPPSCCQYRGGNRESISQIPCLFHFFPLLLSIMFHNGNYWNLGRDCIQPLLPVE